MAANYTGNTSGFAGYGYSNIYPDWGGGMTQNLETTPEPEEQVAYVSTDSPAPDAVDGKAKMNMFVLLGAFVLLIFLFR